MFTLKKWKQQISRKQQKYKYKYNYASNQGKLNILNLATSISFSSVEEWLCIEHESTKIIDSTEISLFTSKKVGVTEIPLFTSKKVGVIGAKSYFDIFSDISIEANILEKVEKFF